MRAGVSDRLGDNNDGGLQSRPKSQIFSDTTRICVTQKKNNNFSINTITVSRVQLVSFTRTIKNSTRIQTEILDETSVGNATETR